MFFAATLSMSSSQGVGVLGPWSMLRSLSAHMSATRKALILARVPSGGPPGGEVAGAVEGVGGAPVFDGLFAVVEDEPGRSSPGAGWRRSWLPISMSRAVGGGSVVGSVEGDVAQGVVGLVVAGEDDDAVLLAGVFDDVVAHGLKTGGGVGGEGVGFEVAFGGLGGEVLFDELFGFEMAGGAVEAFGATWRSCWVRL